MSNNKINILKGLDAELSNKIENAFNFICNANKLKYQVQTIKDFKLDLSENDYLIVYLDELSLNEIVHNSISKEFFIKRSFNNAQVILITDDLEFERLPDYLQYFPLFQNVTKSSQSVEDEDYGNGKSNEDSIGFLQVIFDIIRFIQGDENKNNKKEKSIFIGPPDGNTTSESHKIIRELLQRKYIIKPEIINPSAKEVINNPDVLNDMLDEVDLAIHFISHESLEKHPETITPSYKVNTLVSDYCNSKEGKHLNRIIYVPAENAETSDDAIRKIAQFKSDIYSLSNAELVQTPIEKLKSIILSKIEETKSEESTDLLDYSDDCYLIYPPGHDDDLKEVFSLFEQHNIKYQKSQINLDQLELLQYHQKMLSVCKNVIIFNFGNTEWVQRKLSDIQKSPGWGREKAFAHKIICAADLPQNIIENNIDDTYSIVDEISESNINQLFED